MCGPSVFYDVFSVKFHSVQTRAEVSASAWSVNVFRRFSVYGSPMFCLSFSVTQKHLSQLRSLFCSPLELGLGRPVFLRFLQAEWAFHPSDFGTIGHFQFCALSGLGLCWDWHIPMLFPAIIYTHTEYAEYFSSYFPVSASIFQFVLVLVPFGSGGGFSPPTDQNSRVVLYNYFPCYQERELRFGRFGFRTRVFSLSLFGPRRQEFFARR